MTVPDPDENRRILIIDDNEAIHADFRKILAPNAATAVALDLTESALFGSPANEESPPQYELESAYQGEEGVMRVIEALEAKRPYAIAFVDMRMPPGWDGLKTSQKIWEIDSEIQIVICTAYSAYSWNELSEKIGDNDRMSILKKPFDPVKALQLAHNLTEKWCLLHSASKKSKDLGK
jgi:CheY-like chemotaxis protein